MSELYGDSFIADFFSSVLSEIDTYVDKKDEKYLEGTTRGMNVGVYTLFTGNLSGYKIAYIRCYCPSTDRMFYLGVEPIYNNAKDAIASLYPVPVKLKNHIKGISRQGERFSTTYTKDGWGIIAKMSEQDFQNTTRISGDEYFKKMEYEF